MPPNQIDRRSRSAGSPALPTAITTRPQLASSPAIAVLTKGELAIDSAIRRAEIFDTAHSTVISTSLRAPSPSLATSAATNARCRRGAGRECQHSVRSRGVAVYGNGIERIDHAVTQQ